MRLFIIAFIFISTLSCTTKENSFEQFLNQSISFEKQLITDPEKKFSISIPSNWEWEFHNYENLLVISSLDASPSLKNADEFTNLISIQRVKSFDGYNDLKSEFKSYIQTLENLGVESFLDSGKFTLLEHEAYLIHTESSGEFGEVESICVLVNGNEIGEYYNLNAITSVGNNSRENMVMMVKCLSTFKLEE
jgi:hypothetical protein